MRLLDLYGTAIIVNLIQRRRNLMRRDLMCNGRYYVLPAVMLVLSFILCHDLMAQDPFTKITTGPAAIDAATSLGMAWIDYDNDGYLDIYVVNYPLYSSMTMQNDLYHNNGDGTFTKITGDPITDTRGRAWCGTWADYNNDGFVDMYAINGYVHDNQLYQNNGDGTFTLITSGIMVNDGISSNGGNWIDYNNDGLVDMFTSNDGYSGAIGDRANSLYRNDGGGVFTLDPAGDLATNLITSHSAVWCDYDNDGYADVFVANYQSSDNQLLHNNGDGTFSDIDAGQMTGDGVYSTGASWADYDNDGDFDLLVINFNGFDNFFYDNQGDGTFVRRTDLAIAENTGGALSSCFGDYDNDGDLDLLVTNGDFTTGNANNNFLYKNNGDGTFTKVITSIVATDPGKSCGGAFGDYDRDGDLDLYIARFFNYQANAFYQNNGNSNNWINLKLVGAVSNRSAIGARVRVRANIGGTDTWQLRQVESQSGYSCQNLNVHYGLGDAAIIDSIIIDWPSFLSDTLTDVTPNQFLTITEGDYLDLDEDGFAGANDNCRDTYNPHQDDADSDGIGDLCDNCPGVANAGQSDTDSDGYGDSCDNCPVTANSGQEDIDEDGVGDICDNCPDGNNPGQEDADLDGIGDVCDWICGDVDNNGEVNILDILYLINYKFKDGPAPEIFESSDTDANGEFNILDILILINYKFKDGPEPSCI